MTLTSQWVITGVIVVPPTFIKKIIAGSDHCGYFGKIISNILEMVRVHQLKNPAITVLRSEKIMATRRYDVYSGVNRPKEPPVLDKKNTVGGISGREGLPHDD